MGLKRKKRNSSRKKPTKHKRVERSNFIWMKFHGVGVFWPVKVVTQTHDKIEIFIKSDNAQFEVRKQDKNIQPFHENLERLKAKGIEYLQAKVLKETERCFIADLEWAIYESECAINEEDETDKANDPNDKEKKGDSAMYENHETQLKDDEPVAKPVVNEKDAKHHINDSGHQGESALNKPESKIYMPTHDEKKCESYNFSLANKTYIPNYDGEENESDDNSVADNTYMPNHDKEKSELDDDSVADKTYKPNHDKKESELDDDSVADKTYISNPVKEKSELDDDSVADQTYKPNHDKKESELDDDSVADKTYKPNHDKKESELDDDSVADKTYISNPVKEKSELDDDSVADKTYIQNPDKDGSDSDYDSVADKTYKPNHDKDGSEVDDDSVADKTNIQNPDKDGSDSDDDSVADKTYKPNYEREESELDDDSVADKTYKPNYEREESDSDDDSVADKTYKPNYEREESELDDDSVADKTNIQNPDKGRSDSDDDSVADKTYKPNYEREESELDDDSVADKTYIPNPDKDRSDSDDDSVDDKTYIPNPDKGGSDSDDDSVADRTYKPNYEREESDSDDDSVADKTYIPNPEKDGSDSDDDSVADKTYKPNTDELVSDSAETDGDTSDVFPLLSETSRCFSSSMQLQQEDTESENECLDEDNILRDVSNPNIYIRRVLKNDLSKSGTMKKHERVYNSYQYCGACKLMTSNLAQHITRHSKSSDHPHAADKEIQAIRSEQNDKEKKRLMKALRARYNHESNLETKEKGKGEIILERRPTLEFNLNKYGPCPQCLLWVAKKLLKKHQKKCINRKTNVSLSIGDLTTQSECLAKNLLPIASKRLVKEVFSKMTLDEVGKTAKGDQLIVQLGNQWLEKNVGNVLKRGIYTSQIMRLVGRFLLNLRKICPQGNIPEPSVWQYLKPEYFNDIVKAAVLTASPISDDDDSLQAPSNAIKLGYDLKRLLNGKIGLAIMEHDEQSQIDSEKVLKLMEIYWGARVTKAARVLLEERRYYAEKHLPHPEDILHLNCYLRDSISQLDYTKTDKMNFRMVAELIEAKLVMYNRRRTGELQAVRLQDYVRRTKGCSGEYLVGECTAFEKQLLESQEVMTIRGKTGRGVPVILPSETTKGLEYLTDSRVRASAGVNPSNHYIFASQGDSIVWAYDSLRKAAEAALLKNPAAITSTNLRKYMATVTQVLDLKENQMQWVLNHLGHTMDVHKIHYRATSDIIERTQIAKILLLQDQGRVGEFRNQCLDEIELEDVVFTSRSTENTPDAPVPGMDAEGLSCPEIIRETLVEAAEFFPDIEDTSGLGNTKQRKPPKTTSKCPWTEEEEKEIKELFQTFFQKIKRPKPSDCLKAISKSKKKGGLICKRRKDVLKKKVFRMIDKLSDVKC